MGVLGSTGSHTPGWHGGLHIFKVLFLGIGDAMLVSPMGHQTLLTFARGCTGFDWLIPGWGKLHIFQGFISQGLVMLRMSVPWDIKPCWPLSTGVLGSTGLHTPGWAITGPRPKLSTRSLRWHTINTPNTPKTEAWCLCFLHFCTFYPLNMHFFICSFMFFC